MNKEVMREQVNIHNKKGAIPMKLIWDQSETMLNPMQKKSSKSVHNWRRNQVTQTNKKKSFELRTSSFFEVG